MTLLMQFLLLDTETQIYLLFTAFVRRALPKPYNRTKIAILAEQQNHRCCYCGIIFVDPPVELVKYRHQKRWRKSLRDKRMATVEHIIPKGKGGEAVWENEAAACFRCNTHRGMMDPLEFYENRLSIITGRVEARRQKRRERKKRKKQLKQLKCLMVGATGIEPVTPTMSP